MRELEQRSDDLVDAVEKRFALLGSNEPERDCHPQAGVRLARFPHRIVEPVHAFHPAPMLRLARVHPRAHPSPPNLTRQLTVMPTDLPAQGPKLPTDGEDVVENS